MRRYAVFGHPIAHSRSPRIHAAFGAQCGIELDYTAIDAPPESFVDAVDAFERNGGCGANVTLPHKPAAAALCREVSERARRAGAVNTLIRVDGAWHGDNTDGIGLVRDLTQRHGIALEGARVLLLGAGGAAAGVAPALLDAGIARLAISNRSFERAQALALRLGINDGEQRLHLWGWDALVEAAARLPDAPRASAARAGYPEFDLVINSTAAARTVDPVAWPLPFDDAAPWTAVDLGYGEAARPFLDAARDAGAARGIDGLGMLVEQAAESFLRWHGVRPDTDPVYAMLRAGDGA
ncbi:shikimate dehydrogenase (NADP(+)) [Lysobacter bugurensis]|uniref:Shikimate dehydrogenase (NADP(+)) n=2 Tax=Cognatilysobacter bugurensis TaxID=543356 RepID=A0A918WA21_9GAMM|nr:shikimate dehydrogenase (NADP(+)) [Lysobacter bugurensis]